MSQFAFGNLSSPVSGQALIDTYLEPAFAAIITNHTGGTRPSYATNGLIWVNTTTNPYIINFFDGSDDIALGTLNISTNVFTPSTAGLGALAALNSVGTAQILDNNVTLAKLATQAANTILANATSSAAVPTAVALAVNQLLGRGASGNIGPITLGSGLAMVDNTLTASGGAERYLTTLTANNSALLEYTGMSNAYKSYRFRGYDFIPADNAQLQAQAAYGGSYLTSNYTQAGGGTDQAGTAVNASAQTVDQLNITGGNNIPNSANPFFFDLHVHNPSHTSKHTAVEWRAGYIENATSRLRTIHVTGYNTPTTNAMNKIKFFMSSNDITSGFIDVFGISN